MEMRSRIKRVVTGAVRSSVEIDPATSATRITTRLADADVVSFDVFDTLLLRCVAEPSDVFDLVAARYEAEHGPLPFDFATERKNAYRRAEAAHANPRFDQIYDELECDDETRRALADTELDVERGVLIGNGAMKAVYRWCADHGKTIVFTTDMYLPEAFIRERLTAEGFEGVDRWTMLLSCDQGCTKREGALFGKLVEEAGHGAVVVHMGDSYRSDHESARRAGIGSILLPRADGRGPSGRGREGAPSALVASIAEAVAASSLDPAFAIGARRIGPILASLCRFLLVSMREDGIDRMHFFARDGYLIKKAFDEFVEGGSIATNYLYASRRAFGIPAIMTPEDAWNWLPDADHIPIREALKYVGAPDAALDRLAADGEDLDRRYARAAEADHLRGLIDRVWPEMERALAAQRDDAIAYLAQSGVEGRIGVFDLGWHGRIQEALGRLLDAAGVDADITGYYLGLDSKGLRPGLTMKGMITDYYPVEYLGLIESCFTSLEGSTLRFERDEEGRMGPVLAESEYSTEDTLRIMTRMQAGALAYVERAARITGQEDRMSILSPELGFARFRELAETPTMAELRLLARLQYADYGEDSCLVDEASLLDLVARPKATLKGLQQSRWRLGSMKALLRLPLPYGALYERLKGLKR